jgi:hypothetical protein
MLDALRRFGALTLFCLGAYLVFDLFVSGFNLVVLLTAVGCFVLTHYLNPGLNRRDDWFSIWDVLDIVIELPFRSVALALRLIGRLLRDGSPADL